jgi:hypothetical protein
MPDHHDGPGRRRRATDDADQPSRGCVINVVIKYHRYRCPECGRGELPCLTSPTGCRAQNLIGNAVRIPEPPPHGGSIPATSAGKRPIMIWHPGPGRLGMPEQHQPSMLPRCHGHSVPGPVQQVPALENVVTASGHRKPGPDESGQPGRTEREPLFGCVLYVITFMTWLAGFRLPETS